MAFSHLDEETIRSLLLNSLPLHQQRPAFEHLRACPQCLQVFARVRQELVQKDGLPPPEFYHPLEHALSRLQRVLFLPIWGWNLVLYGAIYLGWLFFVDMGRVFWLQSPWKALWPQLPMAIATSYFLITLPRLRGLIKFLWECGIPYREVYELSIEGVGPILGYMPVRLGYLRGVLPGWLTMVLLLVAAQVLFWVWTPQMFFTRDEVVAQLFLLYDHQIRAAAMWAVVWGVLFIIRVAKLLSRFRLRSAEHYYLLQRRLRTLVLWSLSVGAVTWAVWIPLTVHKEGRWPTGWGEMDVALLFVLFLGYLFLEWKLIYPQLPRVRFLQRVYGMGEIVVALVTVLSPLMMHALLVR